MSAPPTPAEAKRAIRAELLARRARLLPEERAQRSLAIADRLDAVAAFRAARVIALYAPLRAEVDALEIARRAAARGVEVSFPRSSPGERRLRFARCAAGELVPGPLGAAEPPPSAPALEPGDVDCVIVPGVAFSDDGRRLGRGGGHYDATLAAMPRALRIGVGFELQVVPALPHEPHDARLDALVTEARTLAFERESR